MIASACDIPLQGIGPFRSVGEGSELKKYYKFAHQSAVNKNTGIILSTLEIVESKSNMLLLLH